MASSSTQIRNEIEQSQKRLATTVEAIGYKADVGPRAREAVQAKKERALQPLKRTKDKIAAPLRKTRDAAGSGADRVRSTVGESGGIKGAGRRAGQTIQQDPAVLAAVSIGAGVALGLLVKLREKEMEILTPAAQKVRRGARQASEKALDRGKQIADRIPQKASSAVAGAAQQAADLAVKKAKRVGDKSVSKTREAAKGNGRAASSRTPRPRTAGTSMVARRTSTAAGGTRRASSTRTGSTRSAPGRSKTASRS